MKVNAWFRLHIAPEGRNETDKLLASVAPSQPCRLHIASEGRNKTDKLLAERALSQPRSLGCLA